MSIWNNPDALLSGGATLISGIKDALLKGLQGSAEEEEWMNRTGWFGSLINAQKYSNRIIMGANRERIPMILEYQTGPLSKLQQNYLGYKKGSNRKTITMYINPSRMQFSNQKVIGKSITRGG